MAIKIIFWGTLTSASLFANYHHATPASDAMSHPRTPNITTSPSHPKPRQSPILCTQNFPLRDTNVKTRHITDQALEIAGSAGSQAAFKKRLKDSAGKSVTVIVQEAGQTNTFKFTVK